ANSVAVFSRNLVTNALTYVGVYQDGVGGVDGLDGAQSLTFSSDGRFAYSAASTDRKIGVFSRNPTNGTLTFIQAYEDGVDGVDGLDGVRTIALSLDGRFLYSGS